MTSGNQHLSIAVAPSQLHYLQELGITGMQDAPIDHIVKVIEESLGDRKFIEQARWFVLSVFHDCIGNQSQEQSHSILNHQDQLALAQLLLENSGARNSLASILRNRRARYKILLFADRAQTTAQILSNQSKAYTFVVSLLPAYLRTNVSSTPETPAAETISHRRARRRISARGGLDHSGIESLPPLRSGLSVTEFGQLESILNKPVDEIPRRKTTVRSAEDRLSLVAGFFTGVVVFVLVWFLLLK